MGQETSSARDFGAPRKYTPPAINAKPSILEHECILRLRRTPFNNSVRIGDKPPMFLENIDTTLTKLLAERMGGNKLFVEEDIIKLTETCLYTLAYLQTNGVVYKDLSPDNIFYDVEEGIFKLMPVELIPQTSYELVLQGKKFRSLSPQMIIALRMEQEELDEEILHKSNIFILGMVLLEVCTLKPSSDCYDDQNFDILDKAIQQRMQVVREFYPPKIAEMLSVMLEYDYSQRLGPEELSILVNEELAMESNKRKVTQVQTRKSVVCQKKDLVREEQYVQKQAPPQQRKNEYHYPQIPESRELSYQYTFTPPPARQPVPRPFTPRDCNPNPSHNHQPRKSNPYEYQQNYSPMAKLPHSPTATPHRRYQQPLGNSHINESSHKRSTGYYENERNWSPYEYREAKEATQYPSIVHQADFSSKENKEESTDQQIFKIKSEIEKSRKRIQEFNKIDQLSRFTPY